MKQNAFVLGVGMTAFGKHMDRTLKSLTGEAVRAALADAGIGAEALEAAYMATAGTAVTVGQVMVPGQAALREIGIGKIPVVNVENACASAATAFHQACTLVTHGVYDVVLAAGFEKLYCTDKERTFSVFTGAVDFESFDAVTDGIYGRIRKAGIEVDDNAAGATRSLFMDVYAAMAIEHMRDCGSTREDFAAVSAKNSFHGSLNPKAQYRNVMSVDEVLAAREISYPLTLAMCSPIGDGAAAAVIVSEKMVRQLGQSRAVRVRASVLNSGWDYDDGDAGVTEVTCQQAYECAGLGPKDLDVIELHDASSPAELIYYETLGLVPRGEGARFVREGHSKLGALPVNPSGGLLRKGHPVGATGLAQVHELVTQLRGEAGERQVEGARIALAENGGGYIGRDAAAMVISVLER